MSWHEELIKRLETEEFVDLGMAQVYATKSDTDPNEVYYQLVLEDHGITVDTCKGFRFTERCKHLWRLTEWLLSRWRSLQRDATSSTES